MDIVSESTNLSNTNQNASQDTFSMLIINYWESIQV